jgi:hypothetical protein
VNPGNSLISQIKVPTLSLNQYLNYDSYDLWIQLIDFLFRTKLRFLYYNPSNSLISQIKVPTLFSQPISEL